MHITTDREGAWFTTYYALSSQTPATHTTAYKQQLLSSPTCVPGSPSASLIGLSSRLLSLTSSHRVRVAESQVGTSPVFVVCREVCMGTG